MAVVTAIDYLLERAVATGSVPGVVAMATDADGTLYEGAFGERVVGAGPAMTLDTVFWIASMTKPVASVAALQLVEQERLALDEPIGRVLPELNSPLVLTGWDTGGAPLLRSARRPITLRHLLSHTAGFVYPIWNADMQRYAEYAGQPDVAARRADLPSAPLMFDPGERWEYGTNIDWVGRAVEAVSGLDLDAYLREHVFAPLGMRDTGFVLDPSQRSRLVGRHARTGSTSFEVIPFEPPQRPATYNGGGGLYSVGRDYLTFLQALLNGGRLRRAQILRAETVAQLGENQVGDLPAGVLTSVDPTRSNDADFFPQMVKKWGLIGMVTPEDAPTGRSAGSVAWAGLANTYFWLDPTRRVAGLLLTQILPFADRTVLRLFAEFERAIYATSDR